jgi:hypothetical protein
VQQAFDLKQQEKKDMEKKALMASLLKNASLLNMNAAAAEEEAKSVMSSAKIDIYKDPRDQKTLESVDRTDIICRNFMEAVETDKYGFRWDCPNNGDLCQYRHCLPEGMIIIKQIPIEKNPDDEMTLEERIDKEREELKSDGLTRVTKASFEAWKVRKAEEAESTKMDAIAKANEKKDGKGHQIMSGRMLFKYDPTLFKDDENALDAEMYEVDERSERSEDEEKREDLDENLY